MPAIIPVSARSSRSAQPTTNRSGSWKNARGAKPWLAFFGPPNGDRIGIDPKKSSPYCPPRLKAMGLVQHPPHSKSAVARKPTADLERALRHVRPIAPGNGPGSPPPWYLGRSGGLFLRGLRQWRGDASLQPATMSAWQSLFLTLVPSGSSFGSWSALWPGACFTPSARGDSTTTRDGCSWCSPAWPRSWDFG